ncbi:class I SAM-dependent methyltransferase [Nocardia cyriacigeorgica]|uniref:class I SAM-dependent methyltransferase n=1 Tax=Nocardia cyriacigeorgica TaxID=135487 RepID=UPI001894FA11|nr:class I SAM-dependent methyltransferase [Nocardia cyriacigeorgica]MBF6287112.1 methyltransferase domain-containing protein [Nocardia cyriacigeorgica]BDU06460.1 hypothetical protein FMUBM48_27230 [Nocardia cyriacigeorgica]
MSSDVAREYADPSGLRTRIETHARYSARRDDPIADVLSALALNGTEDLADIGCGDGRFLAELAASGHTGQLVGADIATPMAVAAAAVPACHGVRADARRLPFAANAFDVLTARHLLHHVPQPLAALAEFRRITRPGGVVAVVVNHPHPYRSLMDLLARHGAGPAEGTIVDVHTETLPALLHDVFGDTGTRHRVDNELVFPEPEPLIRFAESLFTLCGFAPDHPERDSLRAAVANDIHAWFAADPGRCWREPKGYLVATATCP